MRNPEVLIHAWCDGVATSFVRGDASSASVFGGACGARLDGVACGPRALHHVGTIAFADLPNAPVAPREARLPLFYGLCFDGCVLEYACDAAGDAVEVTFMDPARSTDAWPYADYPVLLPRVPLRVGSCVEQSWWEFCALAPGLNENPWADLTLFVPAPTTIGHSLWGPEGDAAGVLLTFQYRFANRVMKASNACG